MTQEQTERILRFIAGSAAYMHHPPRSLTDADALACLHQLRKHRSVHVIGTRSGWLVAFVGSGRCKFWPSLNEAIFEAVLMYIRMYG